MIDIEARRYKNKLYMREYRKRQADKLSAADPEYAAKRGTWLSAHARLQNMTEAERELHYLVTKHAATRRKERARVDARCAVDPEYAAYVAKWRAARAACDKMTDDELADYKKQKRREYYGNARKRTKQAAQLRESPQLSERTQYELSDCISAP